MNFFFFFNHQQPRTCLLRPEERTQNSEWRERLRAHSASVLIQEGRPVAFESRTLSSTERNCTKIEKEMLAAVHGLEKFHHYTYGRQVHVITDHKPLVSIVGKLLSKAPKRLQSMLLRAQAYNYTMSYRPGAQIPVADALSRTPTTIQPPDTEFENVNSLALSPFKPYRLSEIKQATAADYTLTQPMDTIIKGWPNEKSKVPLCITPYFDYRDELTVQDGIILRGERVVIPTSVRKELKAKVHAGLSGINSCLRRARELIFWPRMSSAIRQYTESCDICESHGTKQSPEPLNMHEVPNRPWEKAGTDIFTIKGRNYLFTVDYFSQFFEADYLPETTSEAVLLNMKKCHDAKEDHYLGILNLRNTPQEGLTTNSSQRLMGRRTKTSVLTTFNLLEPAAMECEKQRMENKRPKVAKRQKRLETCTGGRRSQNATHRQNLWVERGHCHPEIEKQNLWRDYEWWKKLQTKPGLPAINSS